MLLATILLLGAMPQSGDLARSAANLSAEATAEATKDASSSRSLPSTPTPKVKTDAEADGSTAGVTANAAGRRGNGTAPCGAPAPPGKPADVRPPGARL